MSDLENIIKKLDEQARKLDKIETAIVQMAVQDNEIKNMQIQITALWKKSDEIYKTDGPLNTLLITQGQILERQTSCKVHSVSTQVKMMWAAILGLAATIISKNLGGS
jgi:hypothetical protein